MGGVREHVMNISNIIHCIQNGISPLYAASQNGHTDVVDLLVRAGADVHLATTEVFAYTLCGQVITCLHVSNSMFSDT